MLRKFLQKKIEPEIRVKLAKPIFADTEIDQVEDFLKSPACKKMYKYLIANVLSIMWTNEVSEDFKSGWKECMIAMRDMPNNMREKESYVGEDNEWNDV